MGHADSKREKKQTIEQMMLMRPCTMEEMADRIGASVATVSRYLKEFDDDGLLIQEGNAKYKLNRTHYLRDVRLTQLEALTVYLAVRRFIRQTSEAPKFMLNALEKISNVLLTDELKSQLAASSERLQQKHAASILQTRVWEKLLQAWQEKFRVEVEYYKPSNGETSIHQFEPYLFEPAILSHGTYVIGWSHTVGELRTLKVNRIKRVTILTQPFDAPENFHVEDLLRHAWAVWYGKELIQVELLFAPRVAERVLETIWHPSQITDRQPDGSLYWGVQVASELELVPWIRGWGHEVKVLAPPKLKQTIADSLRQAAALYQEE